jgi:hypothetical protein
MSFDTMGMARNSDPETSFEAARQGRAAPARAASQGRRAAARSISRGLTHWEIEEHFGDHGATYRTRVAELCEMIPPLARNSGRRKHIAGGNRVVWVATKYYVELAAVMAERKIAEIEF